VEQDRSALTSTREIAARASDARVISSSPPDRGLKRKVTEVSSDDQPASVTEPATKKMKLADNKIIQITETSSLELGDSESARPVPVLPEVLHVSAERAYKTPDKSLVSPKSRVVYDLVTGLPTKSAKKPKLNKSGPMSDNTNYESQHSEVISLEDSEGRPAMSKSASDISARSQAASEQPSPHCPICLSKLKDPFISVKCGHVCCYLCWLQWFKTKLDCPVCRERTREKNLKKVFFYM
jgi:hypothetical protein